MQVLSREREHTRRLPFYRRWRWPWLRQATHATHQGVSSEHSWPFWKSAGRVHQFEVTARDGRLAPRDIEVTIFNGLGELPLFNPDLEANLPASVVAFHRAVADADALLFASPEYAHGVTGTIENALDWLVGFEPFVSKVVAALNASPRAHHADDALRETLRTMSAVIVESASISIPLLGARLDESAIVSMPSIAAAIGESLGALRAAVLSRPRSSTAEFPITS